MSQTRTPDEQTVLTDSKGRKLTIAPLGPAEMLDLYEAAGDQNGNQSWVRFALVVCTVQAIDGVPLPKAMTKDQVKRNAAALGNPGIVAVSAAVFGDAGGGSEAAAPDAEAAKN